jgi:hypothetical protein
MTRHGLRLSRFGRSARRATAPHAPHLLTTWLDTLQTTWKPLSTLPKHPGTVGASPRRTVGGEPSHTSPKHKSP